MHGQVLGKYFLAFWCQIAHQASSPTLGWPVFAIIVIDYGSRRMSVVTRGLAALFLGYLLLLFSVNQIFAQTGNEWIDYAHQHFKIPVGQDGLYRLTAAGLAAAGVPSGTDPAMIKLFHRGVEQAILVSGGADGSIDPGDYIEFFGQRNDGTLDAGLYQPQEAQPHQYYNLYSDTTSYFLALTTSPGKRMQTYNQPPGALTPATFHLDEKLRINTDQYSTGRDENEVQITAFDVGEGWTGNQIVQTQTIEYTVPGLLRTVPSAGTPTVEMVLVGRGPMMHQGDVLLGSGQRFAGSFTFSGYDAHKLELPVAWADVAADGSLTVRVRCNGVSGGVDRFSVSYVKVRYPQTLDMDNGVQKIFELPGNASRSYLKIANAPSGTRLFDITDPKNVIAVTTTVSATLDAVVESDVDRKLIAVNQVITPVIRPVVFREINPSQYDYIIISNPLLRKPALGYPDPVQAYADYRASTQGGEYRPLVVNVQELYDVFNYGEYSPLAIYHLMRYLTTSGDPKFLLLAGKGLEVFYNWNRNQSGSGFSVYKDFVPSAGYPSSDMAFTAGLSGTTYEPAVPTGRIPAVKSEDIAAYLNKVKEMEAEPYHHLWRKDLMHLSGGIYDGEPELFRSYMLDFQATAEGAQLGGRVSALAKHSKEVQLINIAEQVNAGLNLITFFGHASPTLLDFQLGNVTDPVQGYSNKGKYPTLLMNGCQVGDFNLAATLFGEDWIIAKDKGALGFIGHSGYGFVTNLRRYTQLFYDVGYADPLFVSKGLGEIQKEVARRFMESEGPWLASISQVQQMMLLGDPAVKLFGAKKADLEITDSNVSVASFDGKPITMKTDSFALRMVVRNYGLAPDATIRIEVTRTLSDNTTITYDSLYPLTRYSDTLTMVIRRNPREINGFGDNNFKVTVDPDNVIDEYSKANNVADMTAVIASNATRNLFPSEFAIVNHRDISLSLQAYDLTGGEREFEVELDTAHNFGTAFRQHWKIKGPVMARQPVTLPEGDTITYYWRTRLANARSGESTAWVQSSFTYINDGREGWAQVRFPQFINNPGEGLVKDSVLREFRFKETITPVSVVTSSSQVPNYYQQTSIMLDGVQYFQAFPGFDCRSNTLNMVAFDRKSAVPYLGVKLEWFNRAGRTCGREPMVINSYYYNEMATGSDTDLLAYVNNIQTGDSVVLFTVGNAYFSLWPEEAKTKLGEFGISTAQINDLQDDEPVVIFGRKGEAPGSALILRSSESQHSLQQVAVSGTIRGGYSNGTMHSEWIGPATKWDALTTSTSRQEADVVSFSVTGIRLNGQEDVLLTDIADDRSLSDIDANLYPYIRLSFHSADDTYITSAQLDQWIVTYTPGAEGMLYFAGTAATEQLDEGVIWKKPFGFINISDKLFADSVTVNYEVFNHQKLLTVKSNFSIPAPLPGDTSEFFVPVNTLGMAGMNDVQVFANPRILPEHYYDNNLLLMMNKLEVLTDVLNPVLGVTIDGRRVINGDYVNPNPSIEITLWDENKYVLKTDTAGMRIFLTYPCGTPECAPQQILLSDNRVKWFAATATSDFRIEFHPGALADGEYTLRAEGADARGNGSRVAPFELSFVVKNETTLIVSEAYPNPAKSLVFFKIVVSGGTLPERMELSVMSLNGQLQAALNENDFPPLQIGVNEVQWNVRTSNGNALPNGMYIYRCKVTIGNQVRERIGKLVVNN